MSGAGLQAALVYAFALLALRYSDPLTGHSEDTRLALVWLQAPCPQGLLWVLWE